MHPRLAATLALLAATALPAAAQGTLPAIQAPPPAANPYGLGALWSQGDIVSRATLVVLVLMSLASWYVLVTKLLAQSRMGGQGKAANASFWKADSVQQGAEGLQAGSPYRYIAESALEATRKHDGLIGKVDLNTWMAQSIERAVGTVHSRTQEGLAVLATVGSTAPFVGLFGTVWGIMVSFQAIAVSKNTNLAVVAPGIAEALFATALGLMAAIPAVVFYNKFQADSAHISGRLEAFADEFAAIVSRQIDVRS